jgi:hypothetical protein
VTTFGTLPPVSGGESYSDIVAQLPAHAYLRIFRGRPPGLTCLFPFVSFPTKHTRQTKDPNEGHARTHSCTHTCQVFAKRHRVAAHILVDPNSSEGMDDPHAPLAARILVTTFVALGPYCREVNHTPSHARDRPVRSGSPRYGYESQGRMDSWSSAL